MDVVHIHRTVLVEDGKRKISTPCTFGILPEKDTSTSSRELMPDWNREFSLAILAGEEVAEDDEFFASTTGTIPRWN